MLDYPETYFVCYLTELRNGSAFSREIKVGDRQIACIVYAQDNQAWVFLNSCPHTGVRLEWRPDDFLDASGCYLQCAMHGALFEPASGLCIDGPCVGQSLVTLNTTIDDGGIYLTNLEEIPKSARKS